MEEGKLLLPLLSCVTLTKSSYSLSQFPSLWKKKKEIIFFIESTWALEQACHGFMSPSPPTFLLCDLGQGIPSLISSFPPPGFGPVSEGLLGELTEKTCKGQCTVPGA